MSVLKIWSAQLLGPERLDGFGAPHLRSDDFRNVAFSGDNNQQGIVVNDHNRNRFVDWDIARNESFTWVGISRLEYANGNQKLVFDSAPIVPHRFVANARYNIDEVAPKKAKNLFSGVSQSILRLSDVAAAPFSMARLIRTGSEPAFLLVKLFLRVPILGSTQGTDYSADRLSSEGSKDLLKIWDGPTPASERNIKELAQVREGQLLTWPNINFVFRAELFEKNRRSFGIINCEAFSAHSRIIQMLTSIYEVFKPSKNTYSQFSKELYESMAYCDGRVYWEPDDGDVTPDKPFSLIENCGKEFKETKSSTKPVRFFITALHDIARTTPIAIETPAILDIIGLKAAPVTPPLPAEAASLSKLPINYLYSRKYEHNGAQSLEWLRWIKLERVGHKGSNAAATPVLLRVRQFPGEEWSDVSKTQLTIEGLRHSHICQIFNRLISEPLRAEAIARRGEASLPLAPNLVGAPDAEDKNENEQWVAQIVVEDERKPAFLSAGQCQPALHAANIKKITLFRGKNADTGELPAKVYPLEPPNAEELILCARIEFPTLKDIYGDTLITAPTKLALKTDAGTHQIGFERGVRRFHLTNALTLETKKVSSNDAQTLAHGALDLKLTTGIEEKQSITFAAKGEALGYRLAGFDLTLDSVMVGGVDGAGSDIADQPLIWSESGTALMTGGVLRLTDTAETGTQFSLHAKNINAAGGAASSIKVTIIDDRPMFVGQVEIPALVGATAESETVATWSVADPAWRLVRPPGELPPTRLTLPPQGIAEAWERAKGDADGIGEDARVPARLTPATIIEFEAEERPRNPVAPWNMREQMGGLDVDLPGARLLKIVRHEVLYGLQAHNTPTPGLRIAELTGWRGAPPIRPRQWAELNHADPAFSRKGKWEKAERTLKSRLAMLDVRPETDWLARAKIDDVNFRLRPKSEGGRYLKPAQAPDGTDSWWSSNKEGAISGGALAGFEQESAIAALLREPDAGKGTIHGLQLTALGATTSQGAAFDNGLSRIFVKADLGRVTEVRFERLGRIGALHHVAKHVIVYRRAFLASDQFKDEQDQHVGRPIVRKFEEYVELTQPVRRYPDQVGVVASASGPVLGARFRSTRIAVNGKWAREIEAPAVRGYMLPLWREGESDSIYPRPDVELLVATDGIADDREPAARRIKNPQILHFYSLTADSSGYKPSPNTDNWPLVYGLDHIDRALDEPVAETLSVASFREGADPAATLPPEPAVLPGLEDFALLLEAGPAINLTSSRSETPVFADLRSIVMMRGQQVARAGASPAPETEAAQAEQIVSAGLTSLTLLARKAETTKPGIDEFKKEALKAVERIENSINASNKQVRKLQDKASQWVQQPFTRLEELKTILEAATITQQNWNRDRDRLAVQLTELTCRIGALQSPGEQLYNQIFAELKNISDKDGVLDNLIAPFYDSVKILLSNLEVIRKEGKISKIREQLNSTKDKLIAALSKPPAVVQQAAAEGRKLIAGVQPKAEAALAQVSIALMKLSNNVAEAQKLIVRIEAKAPNAAAKMRAFLGLLTRLHADATADLDGINARVTSAFGGAASVLGRIEQQGFVATETSEAAIHALFAPFDQMLTQANASVDEIEKVFKGLEKLLDETKKSAKEEILTTIKNVNDVAGNVIMPNELKLRHTIDKIGVLLTETVSSAEFPQKTYKTYDDARSEVIDILDGLLELRGDFSVIEAEIRKEVEQAWSALTTPLGALKKEITNAADVANAIKSAKEGVSALAASPALMRDSVKALLDGNALGNVQPASLKQAIGLNLLRAAGAPPIVEQLVFNREQVAYHFRSEVNRIVTGPMTALVDQKDKALKALGIAQPVLGIDGELLSPLADAFNDYRDQADKWAASLQQRGADVLKDFAGLKDLLPKLTYDGELARAIRVTHGFNKDTGVAWLSSDLAYGPKTQPLFEHDLFSLTGQAMKLVAMVRTERSLSGGGETRRAEATITTDLVLTVGGAMLMRLPDSEIRYTDIEGMKFRIKPEKIQFNSVMKLLSDAVATYNKGDSPMQLELLQDEAGRPIGLVSRYDLPPTSMGPILNAAMGVHLSLAQREAFEIALLAYFGRRDAPFAIVFGILGGGGYVEARANHAPALRRTDLDIAISIGASAGTGFALGPLKGSVSIYLGFELRYASNRAGARLSITALLVVNGSVTAWGFVTVSLNLQLAITYDGNRVVGVGTVRIEVRISRFYKKKFNRAVRYRP